MAESLVFSVSLSYVNTLLCVNKRPSALDTGRLLIEPALGVPFPGCRGEASRRGTLQWRCEQFALTDTSLLFCCN